MLGENNNLFETDFIVRLLNSNPYVIDFQNKKKYFYLKLKAIP